MLVTFKCSKLVKFLILPIVVYEGQLHLDDEKKGKKKKMDGFEMWCWRRVTIVSWMGRKTNV